MAKVQLQVTKTLNGESKTEFGTANCPSSFPNKVQSFNLCKKHFLLPQTKLNVVSEQMRSTTYQDPSDGAIYHVFLGVKA